MFVRPRSASGIKLNRYMANAESADKRGGRAYQDLWLPLLPRLSRMAFRARDSSPSTDLGERPII
jgi:hypothetical protein